MRRWREPNTSRDAEMRSLLDQWLQRPKRETYVDLSKTVAVCGSEACQPIPVRCGRLWNSCGRSTPSNSPGGGDGTVEGSGIDYILPYWMGRYYGAIAGAVESAAAPSSAVAPDSLASLYGANLAPGVAQASAQPLPLTLGGVTLSVTDAAGAGARGAAVLRFAGPDQFRGSGRHVAGAGDVGGFGADVYLPPCNRCAHALQHERGRQRGGGGHRDYGSGRQPELAVPVPVFRCAGSSCASVPIILGAGTSVYVSFFGTGIRNRSSLANVAATVNGIGVPVLYAGPAPGYTGLDQVNVGLVLSLRGSGESNVVLTVDGQAANTVTIDVQ